MNTFLKGIFSTKSRQDLRSPLKARPLRVPGQSVDEEIGRLLNEKFHSNAIQAAGMISIAVFEWTHVLLGTAPMPLPVSVVAAVITSYAGLRLIQIRKQIRNLRLGRDGERVFGQFLDDELRPRGYYVLHDLVGGKWNIDHIVVGERGVYTIETKTHSKPKRGPAIVHYDGETISVNGRKPDRDPIAQARAQAAWLRETLARSIGLDVHVQPIVTFPGWFIESPRGNTPEVWVLSGKELPSFIENSRRSLDSRTAKTIRHFLKQMARSD